MICTRCQKEKKDAQPCCLSCITAMIKAQYPAYDELVAACEAAEQLASIASDWGLDLVEIDGEMVDIYELRQTFLATLALAEGTP